ncbi:hypothetical protein CYMTET_29331 [Cymbomonas tetramitiformis]|uniref:SET domain-containing protein n=1 Tax=Cymbomonas tetramitiformis TaxID=36881 RepID=A0AAE0FLG9_9CHLO|nr:hypothetical protein CYMTET_29331 [Cymbomonas tetramitiformis]
MLEAPQPPGEVPQAAEPLAASGGPLWQQAAEPLAGSGGAFGSKRRSLWQQAAEPLAAISCTFLPLPLICVQNEGLLPTPKTSLETRSLEDLARIHKRGKCSKVADSSLAVDGHFPLRDARLQPVSGESRVVVLTGVKFPFAIFEEMFSRGFGQYKRRPRFAPYMEALPPMGTLVTAETMPLDALTKLRAPELLGTLLLRREHTKSVYDEEIASGQALPLFRGRQVAEEEFCHATALITSRSISVRAGNDQVVKFLIPLIDMANHNGSSTNELRVGEGGTFDLIMGEDVHAGEEIRISYGALRNDLTSMHYGFILEDPIPQLFSEDVQSELDFAGEDAFSARERELVSRLESLKDVGMPNRKEVNAASIIDGVNRIGCSAVPTAWSEADALVASSNWARKQALQEELARLGGIQRSAQSSGEL